MSSRLWIVEKWVPGDPKPEAPRRKNGEPNRGPGRWERIGTFTSEAIARGIARMIHGRTRVYLEIRINIKY